MYLSSFLYSHSTETQLQLRLEELQVSCKYIFRIISTVGHCTNCNCTFYRFRSNMEVDMSLSLFSPSSSCSSLARLWSSALPVRPPRKAPPLPPRLPRLALPSRKRLGADFQFNIEGLMFNIGTFWKEMHSPF